MPASLITAQNHSMPCNRTKLTRLAPVLALPTISAPAHAATGLSSLEGLVWVLGFFALLAIAGLIVFVLYLCKMVAGRETPERGPGWILRVATLTLLIFASPVFLVAFSARELSVAWLLTVIGYLAMLTVLLIDLFGNKKKVLAAMALAITFFLVKVSGIVSLTRVTIVENQPFEPTHVLQERLSGRYFRTTDGGLYRMQRGTLPREDLLPEGIQLYLEQHSDSNGENLYTLQSFGKSKEYHEYEREAGDPWLTIPLRWISIDHYQTWHAGRVERIDGTPWKAEERDITGATVRGCCNANWFRELIAHGIDPRPVRIGERNLLHVIANDIHRNEGVVETAAALIEAGIEIDELDAQGQTPLFVAIESYEHGYSQKPELAERFTGYIRLLLDSGADPNIAANHQFSPILEAVISRRYQVARMLLQYGADPRIKTSNGQSGYSRAMSALKALREDEQNDELQQLVQEMEAFVR